MTYHEMILIKNPNCMKNYKVFWTIVLIRSIEFYKCNNNCYTTNLHHMDANETKYFIPNFLIYSTFISGSKKKYKFFN